MKNSCRRPARRHWLRAYSLLELVAATAIFVTSVGLLASTTTTALSTRLSLSRAASLDATLNRALETAASNTWESLAANTFTPPAPLCDGDPSGAGTLARSCLVLNGRRVEVVWGLEIKVESSGVDGIPQGAVDSLVLSATTTRDDGSEVTRTRTVVAPTSGYRVAPGEAVADGVVRVQLTGSWATLDSPLLLLAADTTTVFASTRVGADGAAVMRAPAASCTQLSPCRVALGTGDDRGMTPTHSLDAASLLGDDGAVVLSPGRATYVSARVYRRGVLDVYLQARNTTGGRRLTHVLSASGGTTPPVSAPQAGSVCLWLNFSDGVDEREVPGCNLRDSGRAITFDTYAPSLGYPGLRLAIPTGEAVTLRHDHSDATCPLVPGQVALTTVAGAQIWTPVATIGAGVCSTWTWGRPTSIEVQDGTNTTDDFPEASVTVAAGGHTVVVATWLEGDSARPAAGIPGAADVVWTKPRSASSCPGMPVSCAPAWLTTTTATSPELTDCPTSACYSPAASAPYLRYLTPASGSPRGWPFGMAVAATQTSAFATTVADNEGGSITVSVPSLPAASYGTLSVCTPSCTAATTATQVSVTSGQSINWSWTAGSATTGPTIPLRLTDTNGNVRTEYLHLPRTTGAPAAVFAMRTTARQGGADLNRATVWDEVGNPLASVTVTMAACASGVTSPSAQTGVNGSIASPFTVVSSAATAAANCSITVTKGASTYTAAGAFSREILAAPGSIAVTTAASTQGQNTVVTVTVKDRSSSQAVLAGWNVSIAAEDTLGRPAQSVWAQPAWCVTGVTGSCSVTFSVGTDTKGTSWVARGRAGSVSGSATSAITRRVARLTLSDVALKAGTSADATLTAVDGAGTTLANQTISIVAPGGVTVSPTSGTTDGNGKLNLTIAAAENVEVGTLQLVATSGVHVETLEITALPAPAALVGAADSITVQRDETETVLLTVEGTNGDPVSGELVTVTGQSRQVRASAKATSDASGVVRVIVYVDRAATAGTRELTVTLAGVSTFTFDVVVP